MRLAPNGRPEMFQVQPLQSACDNILVHSFNFSIGSTILPELQMIHPFCIECSYVQGTFLPKMNRVRVLVLVSITIRVVEGLWREPIAGTESSDSGAVSCSGNIERVGSLAHGTCSHRLLSCCCPPFPVCHERKSGQDAVHDVYAIMFQTGSIGSSHCFIHAMGRNARCHVHQAK